MMVGALKKLYGMAPSQHSSSNKEVYKLSKPKLTSSLVNHQILISIIIIIHMMVYTVPLSPKKKK
jgi:hypothetical protein